MSVAVPAEEGARGEPDVRTKVGVMLVTDAGGVGVLIGVAPRGFWMFVTVGLRCK